MPPKGDRPTAAAPAKDKGNKSAAPAASKGAAAAPAKGGLGGFFGGLFGGNKGTSGPTAADRPKARPDVVMTGTGKDARFMDTRTGQSYAAPDYGRFSLRGLTSTDPANVARNRYGREGLEAVRAGMGDRGADRGGIASLVRPTEPAATEATPATPATPAAPTPAQLAMIGAPTTPMAPIFVDSPVYGVGMPMGEQGMMGYGSAFSAAPGAPQLSVADLIDLFGTYPNLGMR